LIIESGACVPGSDISRNHKISMSRNNTKCASENMTNEEAGKKYKNKLRVMLVPEDKNYFHQFLTFL